MLYIDEMSLNLENVMTSHNKTMSDELKLGFATEALLCRGCILQNYG